MASASPSVECLSVVVFMNFHCTPLCEYTAVYLLFLLLMISGLFPVWDHSNNAAVNCLVHGFW